MADRKIGELPSAPEMYDDTLFAAELQGTAMKITGRQIKAACGGGGFVEMETSIPVAARVEYTLYGLILDTYQ